MNASVVIPLHNGAPTIERAIESVLAQRLPPMEIIVVDDGSTDDGPAIVAEAFPEVVLHHQVNMGAGAARNAGIVQARSEWLAFLDADDVWGPSHLELAAAAIVQHPDAMFIASSRPRPFRVDIHGLNRTEALAHSALPIEPLTDVAFTTGNYLTQQPRNPHVVHSSTVLVHRSVFNSDGMRFGGTRIGEDWELWTKIGLRHPLVSIQAVTVIISRTPGSITDVAGRALAEDSPARDCFAYLRQPFVVVANRALESGDLGICDRRTLERFVDGHICGQWKEVLIHAEQPCARRVAANLSSWMGPNAVAFIVASLLPRPVASAVSALLRRVHRRHGRQPESSPFLDVNALLGASDPIGQNTRDERTTDHRHPTD
jgi:glycosyltransferase involved in cell wall biosynthesis